MLHHIDPTPENETLCCSYIFFFFMAWHVRSSLLDPKKQTISIMGPAVPWTWPLGWSSFRDGGQGSFANRHNLIMTLAVQSLAGFGFVLTCAISKSIPLAVPWATKVLISSSVFLILASRLDTCWRSRAFCRP